MAAAATIAEAVNAEGVRGVRERYRPRAESKGL
jgi:hypothetical protein